jgi:hypothetical protein
LAFGAWRRDAGGLHGERMREGLPKRTVCIDSWGYPQCSDLPKLGTVPTCANGIAVLLVKAGPRAAGRTQLKANHQPMNRTISEGSTVGTTGTRGTRIAALTGVAFVVFLVPAVLLTSGEPSSSASAARVPHYILANKSHYSLGGLLSVLAIVFGLFFYGYLRGYFRRLPGLEWLASIFFGGAIVFGVGGALAGGLDLTIGDHPSALSASSLQLLNTLNTDFNSSAVAIGLGILYISVGVIIYKSRALPVWLAWVSWLLGLLGATFLLSFVALIVTPLWVLYVAILLASRNPTLSVSNRTGGGSEPTVGPLEDHVPVSG